MKTFIEKYKKSYEYNFPDTEYKLTKADAICLNKFIKENPKVTPERFAEIPTYLWSLGQYTPMSALTIKGVCSQWAQLYAKFINSQRGTKKQEGIWAIKERLTQIEKELKEMPKPEINVMDYYGPETDMDKAQQKAREEKKKWWDQHPELRERRIKLTDNKKILLQKMTETT
jgi:hypothetical protein